MIAFKRPDEAALSIGEMNQGEREERWSPAATAAFVLATSLGLWTIIIGGVRLALG